MTSRKQDTNLSVHPERPRIHSIDQLRGYAIFGMVLVNVLGAFDVIPWPFKHHRAGYSYADTIAPLFIFVVGMGFRLSFQRRVASAGRRATYLHAVRRYLILCFLGLLYGGFDLRVSIWDALMDIGCAGLLALPFMERSTLTCAAATVAYLAGYEAIFHWTGYGEWTMNNSIDGGPLGPLSWVFLLLMGAVAWDVMASGRKTRILGACLALGASFTALGWILRAPWGEFKPLWHFSQYAMTSPYTLYSTGLCFFTLLTFYILCDLARVRLPHMSLLGKNPLVLYLLQAFLCISMEMIVPETAPLAIATAAFLLAYAIVFATAWLLDRRGIIVKL